ncbi:MAG: hypothetical protein A3H27_02350 [Acidobacteria bacterium RIFCSPLOWO2_02_FULL_59_13]|nr:MAG: hypothetical protein A3H27_02350 [Acidobacteria bacterium RIFCSPLOWO2_02_FULL_59_13]
MSYQNHDQSSADPHNSFFRKIFPVGLQDALFIFLASYLFVVFFLWVGGELVANKDAETVDLAVPSLATTMQRLIRSDTGWYLTIINDGYERKPFSVEKQANWAFFPAYPLIVKYAAKIFSADIIFVGCILSTLSYFFSLYMLWQLFALDFDRETTVRSLLLIVFYPFAFGLVAFGPDSLFLLTICLSLYCARKERWLLAGLIAGITSATRPQGVLIGVPLLYMYLRRCGFSWKRIDIRCLALALVPSGLLLFMFHLRQITGNPLAFMEIQFTWNNSVTYPFYFLERYMEAPQLIGHYGWDPEFLSVLFVLSLIPVILWSWLPGRMPTEYRLFLILQFLVLVSRETTMGNLRYMMAIFPYFLALGVLGGNPAFFRLILLFFAGLAGLMVALFANNYHIATF